MPLRKKDKRITLIDLGKLLNLTPRAVSKALNGEDSTVRVSIATRKRVQALAKRLNYRPDRMAQTLRTGKSGMVGVLAFQAFGHLFQQKLYLARHHAEQHGLLPNIYVIPDASEKSRDRAVDVMLDSKVDAVIIFNDLGKSQVERLQAAGIPLVIVGASSMPIGARYSADLKDGFYQIARHLIAQGSGRLALLNIAEDSLSHLPWHAKCAAEGMRKAVREARKEGRRISANTHTERITFEGVMVRDAPHVHGLHAGGYLGMKAILRNKEMPDALICNGDSVALGALLACAEAGIEIPKNLMIAGFGDDPSSSAGLLPLTSARQPLDELCRIAFDDLKEMTLTGKRLNDRSVVLPYEIVVRESTQPRR